MTQAQTTFLNDNGILTTTQQRQEKLDRFYNWMLMTGNIYINCTEQMKAAYQKIY